jgi:hypothetical protein
MKRQLSPHDQQQKDRGADRDVRGEACGLQAFDRPSMKCPIY